MSKEMAAALEELQIRFFYIGPSLDVEGAVRAGGFKSTKEEGGGVGEVERARRLRRRCHRSVRMWETRAARRSPPYGRPARWAPQSYTSASAPCSPPTCRSTDGTAARRTARGSSASPGSSSCRASSARRLRNLVRPTRRSQRGEAPSPTWRASAGASPCSCAAPAPNQTRSRGWPSRRTPCAAATSRRSTSSPQARWACL
mmetsp:Transcript_24336/g.71117  ORF Transcript_24336/g.71117 Transcript_24336/m.71117 type:complete len:201 (+) Transcript_24336:701-1303(+)